jgi:hypothetical protein
MKRFTVFLFLSFAGLMPACRKEAQFIPVVPVNFSIDLTLPAYFDLTVPTGWIYVSGGSRGIIIYRKSESEFIALDRHSTYNVEDNCQVVVSDDNIVIEDPCSDSEWIIIDGSVQSGPASLPLQQYNTQYSPPFLYVYN